MGKPQYAALPNRALWDRNLTDRDVRNLAVIAAHDRLSHARGTGQGAWASHKRFAALAGTEYSRFSVSVSRLLAAGYLHREPLATDRRKFTYRVIYTDDDSLPSSKALPPEIVCSEADESDQIVCSDPELSDCTVSETYAQYISQREEIDSAEAEEINSPEGARFAARGHSKLEFADNDGAQMVVLERRLKSGDRIDARAWAQYLEEVSGSADDVGTLNHAQRLLELVIERMTDGEWELYQGGLAA